jgi:flavin-dependent dehydrogenase
MSQVWETVIVGGGPGGAIAARKCAGEGIETLLIEKRKMPRDKVCSGMVMGPWAQRILEDEFGPIPDSVLVEPKYLLGYAVHVPGAPVQTLNARTPITWRKHLDTWMCHKAREAGAEIWDEARITEVTESEGRFKVIVSRGGKDLEIETHFLIGADGARSAVRGALWPDLKPTYWHCYRECYNVHLDLPERRFNFFSTIETAPFYFCTHDKDGFLLMEGGAPVGKVKETAAASRRYLIERHGLAPDQEPLWRDGCVEPILYRELFTGSFRPARGNALLVGDAAGLNMPVTGEGVGTALKSGLAAALAILNARSRRGKADELYLQTIAEFKRKFQEIYDFSRRIKSAAATGNPKALSDALLESWREALAIF